MKLKDIFFEIIPYNYIFKIRALIDKRKDNEEKKKYKYLEIKSLFDNTLGNEKYLSGDDLRKMQKEFTFPEEYGYGKEVLNERGYTRAKHLINVVPKKFKTILEVGCGDGMVSQHLFNMGKSSVGIDLDKKYFK